MGLRFGASMAEGAEEPRGGKCARRGGGGSEKRKWQQEEEGSLCPICLEAVALGEDRGPEVLVLNCGHRLHLDCWLACTVPTVAGGSGRGVASGLCLLLGCRWRCLGFRGRGRRGVPRC